MTTNKSTRLLGVYPSLNKFQAKIELNGISIYLGTYTTKEEAHAAYLAKKRELHEFCTI
jgi:hypothetical protein